MVVVGGSVVVVGGSLFNFVVVVDGIVANIVVVVGRRVVLAFDGRSVVVEVESCLQVWIGIKVGR